MFGGSSQSQQFGDTHVYSTFNSTWRKLDNEGPSPRNPMVFTDVNGKFILQYGGIDIESARLLEDAFLLLADAWRELKVINAPLHLTGAKAVVCGEGLYLFGG